MSLLDRLQRKAMTSEDIWREIYGGAPSYAGKSVNWKTALQVSTVFACARVISEGIAQVPFKLFQEKDERTRLPAKEHALYAVLHRRPNFYQTSFEYRETMGLHLALCGQHFSFINRVRGEVKELIPFEPQHVTVKRARDGSLTYKVTPEEGEAQEFPAEVIWHVRGPSWNSYLGLDVVKLAREAIGLAMATEEAAGNLHSNGAKVGGLLSVEGNLSDEKYEQLRKWVKENFEGAKNAGRTMILDRGAKFTQAQQTAVDAQHLETRKYQVEEICRGMRVMPIMVGYSDKTATYASAEQMFLAHMVHTMAPWYERIEQSADANLLTDRDRKSGIYAKFVVAGMLRGSAKDTKDVILGYVNGGLLTPNEGREMIEHNPDPDPASDKLRIPANITGSVPEPDGEGGDKPADDKPDPKGSPRVVLDLVGVQESVSNVAKALESVQAGQAAVVGALHSVSDSQAAFADAANTLADETARANREQRSAAGALRGGLAEMAKEIRKPRKAVFDNDNNPIGSVPVDTL